jgi:hypothetical protein
MAAIRCPNCGVTIAWVIEVLANMSQDQLGIWRVESMKCPECGRAIIQLTRSDPAAGGGAWTEGLRLIAWPRATNRPPCPPEAPDAIREDYTEACLVLSDSPKASAALSRRCLQHILRETGKVKPGNLADEIDQAIANKLLPSNLADNLDAVRHIGNFAAHPTKSVNTGEVIDVEPGEAEWNLDVVEALMDVFYVQSARLAVKKAALNAKLAEAGKQPIP